MRLTKEAEGTYRHHDGVFVPTFSDLGTGVAKRSQKPDASDDCTAEKFIRGRLCSTASRMHYGLYSALHRVVQQPYMKQGCSRVTINPVTLHLAKDVDNERKSWLATKFIEHFFDSVRVAELITATSVGLIEVDGGVN